MRYLIITHAKNPQGKHNESINLDSHMRKRYSTDAAIILDFEKQEVVKNRFRAEDGSKKTFKELSAFYKQHYPEVIAHLEAKYEILNDMDIAKIISETVENGEEVVLTAEDVVVEDAKS